MATNGHRVVDFSSTQEATRILDALSGRFAQDETSLPKAAIDKLGDVAFKSSRNLPYFPIPLKETETAAALKAIEGAVASCLVDLRERSTKKRTVGIDLERTTAFLFQTYVATVGGRGKLEPEAKKYLKGNWSSPIVAGTRANGLQIRICFKRSLTHIGACQPICTRRVLPGSITISMAH